MNKQIFRKKSIAKVSSPEQLDQYIRVANPGVWAILIAVVILLAGVVAWGYFGHLDTTLSTAVVANEGEGVIYVKEADASKISAGMLVRVDGREYTITDISKEPVRVDSSFSDYALHAAQLIEGEWVYAVKIDGKFNTGVHKAEIVVETISPISFILN